MEEASKNLFKTSSYVKNDQRAKLKNQKPFCLWFTGLSGSGKSTISNLVDELLYNAGKHTSLLDGDNVRCGLNSDLGFSKEDRDENIRRVGHVCKLMCDAGLIVIASFISPYKAGRDLVRNDILENFNFIEVYVKTSVEDCKKRDPNKLYQNALSGKINNFTGIDSLYEVPENPEIIIDTSISSPNESAQEVIKYLQNKNLI